MDNRRAIVLISIIAAIVVVVVFGGSYYGVIRPLEEKEARLEVAVEAAGEYEAEIRVLEKQKSELWQAVSESSKKTASVTLGFVNMSEETYTHIVPLMEAYGYTGTIVWSESNDELLDAWYITELIDQGWDVVIGGDLILDDERAELRSSMEVELFARGLETTGMYYLEEGAITTEQQTSLLEAGVTGFLQKTSYRSTIYSYDLDNGLYQVEYAPFFYGENQLVTRLESAVEQKAAYMIAMGEVVSVEEELTDVNVSNERFEAHLARLQMYVEAGTLQVQTITELMEYNDEVQNHYEEQLDFYEESIVDIDEKMEELEIQIDAVYEQWRIEEAGE